MGLFDKAFNKFAETGNKLNKGINHVVGKEVFGEINTIEAPRQFADYSTFPAYDKEEPAAFTPKEGQERVFPISGAAVTVSKALDTCMKYRMEFEESATYYLERFKYKYSLCVHDFDELNHYFPEMYMEGLLQMITRAHSLLLPFGVFDINAADFNEIHVATYKRAINSIETMMKLEENINQRAQTVGNATGNSIQMQGGGFGLQGAMKGVAKAEAFNIGMGLLGKYVANQMKMTPKQKEDAFNAFKTEVFFEEVYSDYFSTLYTLIGILSEKGLINGVKAVSDDSIKTMILNLNNPMFPKDKIPQSLAALISTYPFEKAGYEVAKKLCDNTDEITAIEGYFIG